jgi:hypothetical protein
MSYEWLSWVALALGAVNAFGQIWGRYTDRSRENAKDLAALGNRVTKLESKVDQGPTHTDMSDLTKKLGELSAVVQFTRAKVEGLETTAKKIGEDVSTLVKHELAQQRDGGGHG